MSTNFMGKRMNKSKGQKDSNFLNVLRKNIKTILVFKKNLVESDCEKCFFILSKKQGLVAKSNYEDFSYFANVFSFVFIINNP